MRILSGILVVAFGVFLIALAGLITMTPWLAERFLRSFASSPRAHYLEQSLRLIVGGALTVFAPAMWFADFFTVLGWMIVVTTIALLLLPWRWHHEFANRTIPLVIAHMRLFALVAFTLGVAVFYGVSRVALQ